MDGFFGMGLVGDDYVNQCIFDKWDKDGSRQLEKEEIKKMLRKDYGLNPDQIGVQSLLLDTDGDGNVRISSFCFIFWLPSEKIESA